MATVLLRRDRVSCAQRIDKTTRTAKLHPVSIYWLTTTFARRAVNSATTRPPSEKRGHGHFTVCFISLLGNVDAPGNDREPVHVEASAVAAGCPSTSKQHFYPRTKLKVADARVRGTRLPRATPRTPDRVRGIKEIHLSISLDD